MNRRQPSTAALVTAAIVVILSLAALVVLPLIMTQRIEHYRAKVEKHVDPARVELNEISFRLSQQIASLTRAAATRDDRFIAAYRAAVVPQEEAMRLLATHTGVLSDDFDSAYAQLHRRMDRWHESVRTSVDAQRLAFDENYPAVIEGLHGVDAAVTSFQADARRRVQLLSRIQVWVTGALALLAAVAALIVLWVIARLRALASMLSQESAARQDALDRERSLVRIRDDILGVVSHDLRSPLTTIALSTQLIPGSRPEEQSEHIETIVTTTRRMERLIQDLLDVTKIENSRLSVRHDTLDPVRIARQVVASHTPIAASKNILFEAEIEDPLPQITGDEDRIAQALDNLLGNAFKFTPEGRAVRLTVRQGDGTVRFEVADEGPGIAPSELPNLFEPFWQARKTAHLGAGLGLKITRAIIEAHDGSISVRNGPGGGAEFAFELPVA